MGGIVRPTCRQWVEQRHPSRRHFVSAQVAEVFACLAAMVEDDSAAAALAR